MVRIKEAVFRFYHDQLSDDRQRTFYTIVEAGIFYKKETIVCPRILELTQGDYIHILEHIYDDHPEFFYFYPLRSQVTLGPITVEVKPFYRYPEETRREYEAALEAAVDSIMRQCFPAGADAVPELQREKAIFDWITRNVVYDKENLELTNVDPVEDVRSVAWNAYGALVQGRAVCEGIACAFKLLCDRAGLPSIVVLGKANERHAWNIVRINKKFYHVDCTWDLKASISTQIPYARYRYLNLPDKIISATHKAESAFLPKCGSLQYNPFRIRGLCASSPEEAVRIGKRLIDQGHDRFALMGLGFDLDACALDIAQKLADHAGCQVLTYRDKSGYFLGIVIDK